MNKKALNPVVTVALLIALAVVLALAVWLGSKSLLKNISLSPDESCRSLDFDNEILFTAPNQFSIAIVNKGNIPIVGVIIQEVTEGTTVNREETDILVSPGATETKTLTLLTTQDKGNEFFVVPKVAFENGEVLICPNEFGKPAKTLEVTGSIPSP